MPCFIYKGNSVDAIDYLISQHRSLENLLDKALDEQDANARGALFAKVADELTVHISSEEQVFYPAVNACRTEDALLESLEEHLSLKRLMADLLELDPSERTFEPKFKVLAEQTEHHHKEEEEHLFPDVRKMMGPEQLQDLARRMQALQKDLRLEGAPREAVADQTAEAAPLPGESRS